MRVDGASRERVDGSADQEVQPGAYSGAKGAARKRAIDRALAARGIPRDQDSVDYWLALIREMSGKRPVLPRNEEGLQLFIIKDGWEGFLPSGIVRQQYKYALGRQVAVEHDYKDGDSVRFYNPLRNRIEPFDANDALVALKRDSASGEPVLRGAFPLLNSRVDRRLDFADGSGWHNKTAFVSNPVKYRVRIDEHTSIPSYRGISVRDGDGYHSDLHGYLGTHGCIQVSPLNSRGERDNSSWNAFAAWHLPPEMAGKDIGTMHVVGY